MKHIYYIYHYSPSISDLGMMPIKTFKHNIPPNDPKFDHWRTPLDLNIEWKSQDFHNAIYKIEPYKYARRIPIDKVKILPPKEDTSLKTSPILTEKEILFDVMKPNAYKNINFKKTLTNTSITNDKKVLIIFLH